MRPAWCVVVLFAACGPREPGAKPGETLYWRITQSELSFTQCTDESDFRDALAPVGFDENTYFVYRVEKDGRNAVPLTCQSFDQRTCTPSDPDLKFQVAGAELYAARENKSPLGSGGCNLQTVESWTLNDRGETLEVEVSYVLSLVDAPEACASAEEQLKAQASNGMGLQGCVVRYLLGAELR